MPHHSQGHSLGFDSVFKNSLTDAMAAGRWQDLVAGMGADVAESVRGTLASVAELVQLQRLGTHEARWLQAPLRRLYQVGVAAQRLSRFADHPRITQVESVALDDVVADAVIHYQKRSRSHRMAVELTALEVMAQPESLAAAVDALFQWGMKLGRVLNLRLVKSSGLPSGELWLRVEDLQAGAHEERNLNSIDWHVLWQLARLKGVKVKRKVEKERIRVTVRFNRVMNKHSGMAILEQGLEDDSFSFDSARTSVWAVIPRNSLSGLVMNTLRPHLPRLEPIADLPALLEQETVPDCIVSVAEVLETDDFRRWRRKAQERRGRSIAVIEVTPQPNVFDIGGLGSRAVARLSVDSVSSKLLSALVFELSQLTSDPD
jgi:hypothetical protein